ncbi:MAG: hypothetical protein EOO44_22690 [Flavobacterium sp.]|nr:MAG: hypothetical protein EOO44_22690 [Flavobacterium sp.]
MEDNFKNSLKRLKKCDMYWDEMKPNENGRLCQQCNKTIIDFSKMSFREIVFKMAETNESTCGFYLPEQLAAIKLSKSNIPLSIGLTTLIASTALANPDKKVIENHLSDQNYKNNNQKIADAEHYLATNDSVIFSGRIEYYDSIVKKNVTDSYAAVMIKGTTIGIGTTDTGMFKLTYLPNSPNEKTILLIRGIGFKPKEIEVNIENNKNIDLGVIILEAENQELTSFYVTKRQSFMGRMIEKITKPFR